MDDVNKGPTPVWEKCVGVWLNNTTIGTPVYGANATPDDAAFNPARIVFNEPVVKVTSRTLSQPVVVKATETTITEKYEFTIPVRGYTGKFYGHHQGPFFQKWYRGVAASSLAPFLGIPKAETAVGSRSYKMYSVIAVDYN